MSEPSPTPVQRRSNWTLAAFAASCLPYAALGLPVYVTLPEFYASHVGVPLAAVSLVFLIVRLADIVVDPFLGMVIDRTSTKWGRYRVWMAAGAPILMGSVAMLFFAGQGASTAHLAVWLVIMYLGYSISLLSQMSWASILSPDYDQRSRIYGWWQAANIVGVLAVLAIPAIVQGPLDGTYIEAVRAQGWFIIGVVLHAALHARAAERLAPTARGRARNPDLDRQAGITAAIAVRPPPRLCPWPDRRVVLLLLRTGARL